MQCTGALRTCLQHLMLEDDFPLGEADVTGSTHWRAPEIKNNQEGGVNLSLSRLFPSARVDWRSSARWRVWAECLCSATLQSSTAKNHRVWIAQGISVSKEQKYLRAWTAQKKAHGFLEGKKKKKGKFTGLNITRKETILTVQMTSIF